MVGVVGSNPIAPTSEFPKTAFTGGFVFGELSVRLFGGPMSLRSELPGVQSFRTVATVQCLPRKASLSCTCPNNLNSLIARSHLS
jgi:hypothetical protein